MNMLNRNQPLIPTTYTSNELQHEWEFKILASRAGAFCNPVVLQKVREEEAQAGWVLLEKIDDSHLRFKRPASARVNDRNLAFDAYRTIYKESWLREGLPDRLFLILGWACFLYAVYLLVAFIISRK